MTYRYDPDVEKFLAAFAARDYVACYRLVGSHAQRLDQLVFYQLVVICLQRLGQTDELGQLSRLLLNATEDPWDTALLQLTFGKVDLDSVRHAATNNERLCQATYYAGARLLTIGRADAAEPVLRESAGQAAECLEHRLAEIELSALSAGHTPDQPNQVFEFLHLRADTSLRQGQYAEGIRAAEDACDLARRTWGQDDLRFLQGLSILLVGLGYAGRTAEALELAPLAGDLAREHYGDNEPEFAAVLNTVAFLHKAENDLDKASALYQAAVDIWSRSVGYRLESATALNNLAQIAVERRNLMKPRRCSSGSWTCARA